MLYRRFGRTNLQMPVISCGGMRYQFKWQDVPLAEVPADSQANLEACIRRAVDLGINHIETARGYGSSERQLGLILPKLPREKLIVQTKVGPEKDPAVFTANVEESLQRLNLGHVDLLAIHGINDEETLEQAIGPGGCLEAARKIQQRGLAKHIGFSTHGALEVILKAIAAGFDYVNLHWYYIFQRNWPAVLEATRRDMGVFIISPSDKGGMLYKPTAKLLELCKPLHPIVFNDLYCLLRPEVHTLSVGAARPGDFDLHVEAADRFDKARQLVEPIVDRLNATYNAAVPAIVRDPFHMHLPEWQDAPGEINVQVILWLRNLVKAYGMTEYGQMRYNLLGNGGHWFPGKNAAEIDGVGIAALAAKLGLNGNLAEMLKETHEMLGKEAVKRLSQS